MEQPVCPFCPFVARADDDRHAYESLAYHVEVFHREDDQGDSPFMLRPQSRSERLSSRPRSKASSHGDAGALADAETVYVNCPADCGEALPLVMLSEHMGLHEMEGTMLEDAGEAASRTPSPRPREARSLSTEPSLCRPEEARSFAPKHLAPSKAGTQGRRRHSGERSWKEIILGPTTKNRVVEPAHAGKERRLGKKELGPHAFEEQMPAWLLKQLQKGAPVGYTNTLDSTGRTVRVEKVTNETVGVIPILAQLLGQDRLVSKAWLCSSSVKYISKQHREGGFCGYRNIQMLLSYVQATRHPGHQHFSDRTPTIPFLQDQIEAAWDQGFNSSGRIETGGIRGTRKYIGTPEAQALLLSLGIRCEARAHNRSDRLGRGEFVHDAVLQSMLEYFSGGVTDPAQKIYQTSLPPVYFQHPGHSVTIVGLEVKKTGSVSLLVLDPMFSPSPAMLKLLAGTGTATAVPAPEKLLRPYRRGDEYLGKYKSFETLQLAPVLSS